MRWRTRIRSSLSGKAASVYILSLYSRAWSCSTGRAVNIDFRQGPIGVSTDVPRRVLHRVRRVSTPYRPRAARVRAGWASAAFTFAFRSFVNAACSLHGRGPAPRLPRPARCRSCRRPSDPARSRVPARFSSLICCRCAGSRSWARYSSILTREHSSGVFIRPNVPSRGRGAQSLQRINNRGVLRSERFRSPRSKPDASHHVGASRMAKDIEQQLDAIFAHHKARVEQARNEAAGKTVTEEDFTQAATACLASVIAPALRQMAQALNERGVAARVLTDGGDARIDISVSRHARLGHCLVGYPYLRARPDRQSQRIHFEQNTYVSRGGSGVGDYTIAEVNAELVKAKVIGLVRELYGPV